MSGVNSEDQNRGGGPKEANFIDKYRGNEELNASFEDIFQHYDRNRDDFLDEREFQELVRDLFSKNGKIPPPEVVKQLIEILDEDKDGKLGRQEKCWVQWLKQVLCPVSALLIVDVQNDFIVGSLALSKCSAGEDGSLVIPIINKLLKEVPFDMVIYTMDWHNRDHISFFDNVHLRALDPKSKCSASHVKLFDTVVFSGPPKTKQKLWPCHCIQNSWGAQLHKDLLLKNNACFIYKGTNSNIDSYSAFWDNNKLSETELARVLQKKHVTDVYVCGVATDICVGFTTEDSVDYGFRTVLIEDASKGVNSDDILKMKKRILQKGACIVNSSQTKDMVEAKDCRIEMGLLAATRLSQSNKHVANGNSKKNGGL